MPIINKTPEKLRPYTMHGVNLEWQDGDENAIGDCPWCGRDSKFSVNIESGLWRCYVCNTGSEKASSSYKGGNVYTFLQILHENSSKTTTQKDWEELAKERKLLHWQTLQRWGVYKSAIDKHTWLIPGYSPDGKLIQLYRYIKTKEGKQILLATATLSHALHGPEVGEKADGPVHTFEGPWDGMAFWEVATQTRRDDEGKLVPTSNRNESVLGNGQVIAIPGCNTFLQPWQSMYAGRSARFYYDNDHPREFNGKIINPPGREGVRRAVELLARASDPPSNAEYIHWGSPDSDHDPLLPSGWDVRDHLATGGMGLLQRSSSLATLLQKMTPIPDSWIPGRAVSVNGKSTSETGLLLTNLPCTSWKDLMEALGKACRITEGIERTVACCLSSILSVESAGDQLWILVIGPPSSFKSTICEALSVNRKYVLPKDTLTGLFSGYQTDNEGSENLSLAEEMMNKTLVIKDADTIMQSPYLAQIMSQLRGLYDRCMRTQYKNKMSKNWESISSTVILFGTASMLTMDSNDRGARFLTVQIQGPDIIEDLERDILMMKLRGSARDITQQVNCTAESRESPDMIRFKRMCGGYISYLRDNGPQLLASVRDTDSALNCCGDLAQFVSYMRCRPPKDQDERVEREMPYRLGSQLVRLAKGLAVVLNKEEMDDEVLKHVIEVGRDSARGKTMEMCDHLFRKEKGADQDAGMAILIGENANKTRDLLRFLKKIGGVESYTPNARMAMNRRWRLTKKLQGIYERVYRHYGEGS